MPEYLAPGVFVEEVSFRNQSIEGVPTSTAGFVGPTRFGPVDGEPELLTSFADFERIYGGIDQLEYAAPMTNYLAQAVRGYFDEGGTRLYVSRVYRQAEQDDGIAIATLTGNGSPAEGLDLRARYPGNAGNFRVEMTLRVSEDIRAEELIDPINPGLGGRPILQGAQNHDTVVGFGGGSPDEGVVYRVQREIDQDGRIVYRLFDALDDETQLAIITRAYRLTVGVVIVPQGRFEVEQPHENLTFHPEHRNSLFRYFAASPASRTAELTLPLVIGSEDVNNGPAIAQILLGQPSLRNDQVSVHASLFDGSVGESARTLAVRLSRGRDGERPRAGDYQGDETTDIVNGEQRIRKSGLLALEDIEDIFTVAAPGATYGLRNGYAADGGAITRLLIIHAERMRYRVAILDSGDGQSLSEVRSFRASIDSTRAALYYPWVRTLDPFTEREIVLPPSGFIAGIYARNDIQYGVHKAPANEVVRLASSFETMINKAQQEALNPDGVNCLRSFEGRGHRVWGARTASSDPEWKYLNVRRYFHFLERSVEQGTQWAVFENNGPVLWANIRSTVEDFLYVEFRNNRLFGAKPAEAYFVRCDRTTMTQNDIDNGRLVCLVGVAPLRPAEFVIFRIGQKTADAAA